MFHGILYSGNELLNYVVKYIYLLEQSPVTVSHDPEHPVEHGRH